MNLNQQLSNAIFIAVNSHRDQFDKGGKPYILHCIHLMGQFLHDPELAAIAVLHDVIEDTSTTAKDLIMAGFSGRIIDALCLLTRKDGQSYSDYISGISLNKDAIDVKLKDLEHNSDIMRLNSFAAKDIARVTKYHEAFIYLNEVKQGERK